MDNNAKSDTFNENNQYMFDYSISGLGQGDYENEDLFSFEPETLETTEEQKESTNYSNNFSTNTFGYANQTFDYEDGSNLNVGLNPFEKSTEVVEDSFEVTDSDIFETNENITQNHIEPDPFEFVNGVNKENEKNEQVEEIPSVQIESVDEEKIMETEIEEVDNNQPVGFVANTQQNMFETSPIEELNKLTEYTEDKIRTTNINELFDRVGVNVKEASDIFQKNTEMKAKIDARFEELKKLQSEVEKAKKNQIDEINSYKQEVLTKLTEKKEEIEKRLNKLKEYQNTLEKDKQEFEQYKKTQKAEIQKVQKEIQDAYESRREELNHIEDVLRKQKDSLDEERNKLSLDIIQYEADKNELANNLLKFNEIVGTFTNGMDKMKEE